tara:strand:+ start:330 stop:740 length:411 start_codon:yes stop_codon:yes gene_type:complete
MKSRSKPTLQVEKRDGQFLPLTQYDAHEIEAHPNGQLYDVKPVAVRSDPHHKLYWAILGKAVRDTNLWASSSHLHDDLKMLCGHYRTVVNQASGGIYYVPDSIAYNKMDQSEFSQYFEQSMMKLSETLGYDPTILK